MGITYKNLNCEIQQDNNRHFITLSDPSKEDRKKSRLFVITGWRTEGATN